MWGSEHRNNTKKLTNTASPEENSNKTPSPPHIFLAPCTAAFDIIL